MNEALISLVIGVATFISTWGAIKAKLGVLEKAVEKLQVASEGNVSWTVFQEIIGQMKEDHKELKADVKEILNLLNEFKRGT